MVIIPVAVKLVVVMATVEAIMAVALLQAITMLIITIKVRTSNLVRTCNTQEISRIFTEGRNNYKVKIRRRE